MLQQFNSTQCIITVKYKGLRVHPVLFSKHFFPELAQLSSETGARDVIKNNQEHLLLVDVDDAGVIRDVDTKDDLDK